MKETLHRKGVNKVLECSFHAFVAVIPRQQEPEKNFTSNGQKALSYRAPFDFPSSSSPVIHISHTIERRNFSTIPSRPERSF